MILETKRLRGFRAAGISRRNIHKFESPPKTVVTSTAIKISVFFRFTGIQMQSKLIVATSIQKGCNAAIEKVIIYQHKKTKIKNCNT